MTSTHLFQHVRFPPIFGAKDSTVFFLESTIQMQLVWKFRTGLANKNTPSSDQTLTSEMKHRSSSHDQATGSFRVSSLRIIWMTSGGSSISVFGGAILRCFTSKFQCQLEQTINEVIECVSWRGLFSWGLETEKCLNFLPY